MGTGNALSGYPLSSGSTGSTINYDLNGNMTVQQDKGITIQYNYLNLPGKVTQNSKVTDYTYRADGVKVKKIFGTDTTDYLDGFQYENSTLKFFPTADGYYNSETRKYVYNYTDHLGNARVSFAKNSAGDLEVTDTNNYYPFGLNHISGMLSSSNFGGLYSYKYNGKELQETGMYDYGARFYMPDLGRWGVIDPLAEKMRRWSPYNYAFNNPLRFIDPDGRAPKTDFTFNIKTGDVKQVGETNNLPDRILKTNDKGNVEYNKKGEAKVAVDNIAKGILKDGQNFKTSDNIIDVGGKGEATLEQVEDFAVKISDYVGVELTGAYLSKDASENGTISKVYLDKYKNNTYSSSIGSLYRCNIGDPRLDGYFKNTDFHTHPTTGYTRSAIENASKADLESKQIYKSDFYKFLILTKEASYPYNVQKIDYTND